MEYEEFIRKVGQKIKEIRVSSVRSIFKISKRLKVKPKDLLDV
uniref:Uncharacterized protein n=1 Tax=Leptospira santarosai serovar Arenal str. MAVJ 401 TaxID=1049976 RepID=M6JLT5_9LEPT|nr:hypothetical protein LEP1GSC063_1889 [Leptospira santarosai serovar Arenal str. MAVJ 401]